MTREKTCENDAERLSKAFPDALVGLKQIDEDARKEEGVRRKDKGVNPTNLISVEFLWTRIYETNLIILLDHGYKTPLLIKHGLKPLTETTYIL